MATREIELILKLRKQINKSQLTDIREQLRSITKALDDSQFSKRYIEWTRKAGKATTVFRGKINQLIIRVEVLRRRMESLAGIEPLGNIGKNIEKLSETTRRVTKEFGGLARESIPKMDKLSSSLKKTTDSANAFSDIVGEKLPPFVRSFTGEIESNRAALEMMNRDSQRAFNGLEMLGTGAESIVPHVHAATGSIAQMSLAMTQAVPQAKVLEQTLSSLEIKLLKFKAIGSLTGMLDFEKSLRGLRVFREELEKLRFDFARVFQEKPTFAGGGVTDKMISNFIKLRESMDLLKVKAEQTFPNIKAHIDSLRATKSEFDSLRASIQESTGAFVPNLQQITFHKAKLKELEPTIEAVAQKYVSLRTKLIGAFRDIGVELNKAAMYPGSFASALKRSEGESLASMQALATGVKKIEQSYEETIKRTEMNLRKFARTNAQTFEQASFDQEANLRWLEKTEMAMLELDKIYRDFAVAAAKGGQGFLATKQGAEQANAVIAKAIELEERLTGTQKRRAASIRMNVESQRVQKTVTDQVVAIEQNLAETLARVNAEQSALAITNTKLSESEIFLSKRIANLRAKSEALITSIIQLTACLRALDPTSKKDAAQIAKLSARLEVLQKEAIVTTSSMERLERQMRKGADASRAMDRVSAKGFANMITSQAAWMAGFQMIFGSLDKIKSAFMSLVSLQNALVRAMRTARSDIQGYSEIWESYEKAMVRARVRTGTEMEDLGEILYQLGSAGLSAEESVAALDSTLNNLIGTEADVKNITKLIAGLYNNFADQIVKVNGQIVSVSATTEDLGNATREAASQTEKFAFINDLLVAAFRDNQVEMNEMRDGLKFMAQSSRAANLSLTEQAGILAFLNNHLIKAGQAGRAMRVILSKLTKDASGFADAFDIEIDLEKPLNFLEIMESLDKKYGGSILSVQELGLVFKRLGLRGAEAFNLIMRNTDEVRETIRKLEKDAKGAAETMMEIKLSDLTAQAKKSSAAVEALLRNGIVPLGAAILVVLKAFNKFAEFLGEVNIALGGTLGYIIKFAGAVVSVRLLALAFRNLGLITDWVFGVFKHLFKNISDFGKVSNEAKLATATMKQKFADMSAGVSDYRKKLVAAKVAQSELAASQGALYSKVPWYTRTTRMLKVAWIELSAVMKTVVILAMIAAIMALFKWLDSLDKKLRDETKTIGEYIAQLDRNGENLKKFQDRLQNTTDVTEDDIVSITKMAKNYGLHLDPAILKSTNFLGDLNDEITTHIERLEKTRAAQENLKFSKDIKIALQDIKSIDKYGKKTIGLFNKWMANMGKTYHDTIVGDYNKANDILYGGIFKLAHYFFKLKDAVLGTSKQLEVYALRSKNAFENIQDLNKEISEWTAKQEKFQIGSREYEEIQKVIDAARKEKVIQEERYDLAQKRMEAIDKEITQRQKLNQELEKSQTVFLRSQNKMGAYVDSVKGLGKEINNFYKSLMKAEVLKDVFSNLQLDHLGKDLENFQRKISFGNIVGQIEGIGDAITVLGNMEIGDEFDAQLVGIVKGLNEAMKETMSQIEDHAKAIEAYKKEIDSLKDSLIKLNFEKLKNELYTVDVNFFNLAETGKKVSSSFSSVANTGSQLRLSLDGLKSFISMNESSMDSLISSTEKYTTKVKTAAETVFSLQEQVNAQSLALDSLNRSSEEYAEISSNLIIDEKKLEIAQARLERSQAELNKQVGSEGVRSIQQLRDAREEEIRKQEDRGLKTLELEQKREQLEAKLTTAYEKENKKRSDLEEKLKQKILASQEKIKVAKEALSKIDWSNTKAREAAEKRLETAEKAHLELTKKTKTALDESQNSSKEVLKIQNQIAIIDAQITASKKAGVEEQNRSKEAIAAIVEEEKKLLAFSEQQNKQRDIILKALQDQKKTYSQSALAQLQESNLLGDSLEGLKRKQQILGNVKSVYDEIKTINSQIYDEELAKIQSQLKSGAITEKEARTKTQQIMIEKLKASSELEQKVKDLIGEQVQTTQQLIGKTEDYMSTLKEGLSGLLVKIDEIHEKFQEAVRVTAKVQGLDDVEAALQYIQDKYKTLTMTVMVNTQQVEKTLGEGDFTDQYRYSGGAIRRARGGLVPARVTDGEGYIPPKDAMGMLNTLNSLNGGRSTPVVPSNIARFTGPSGVDRIPALLPKGSYVLSKKGMEAYDRSLTQGARHFAAGGEVDDSDVGINFTSPNPEQNLGDMQDFGRFTIVIERNNGKKEFPIYGQQDVLKKLRKELETERLTRLQ